MRRHQRECRVVRLERGGPFLAILVELAQARHDCRRLGKRLARRRQAAQALAFGPDMTQDDGADLVGSLHMIALHRLDDLAPPIRRWVGFRCSRRRPAIRRRNSRRRHDFLRRRSNRRLHDHHPHRRRLHGRLRHRRRPLGPHERR